MAGPKEIRPQGLPQKPQLDQVEAEKSSQQARTKGRVSPEDAARLAQRAGFDRTKKRGKIDIGDSSDALAPLPDDDVDPDVWSQEGLDHAKQNLALAGAQFQSFAAEEVDESLAENMAASSFLPTQDGVTKLQDLADRPVPTPMPMDEVTTNAKRLFNLELEGVPPGHQMIAAGMIVAGEKEALEVKDKALNEKKVAQGIQRVTEKSNQAVGEAQRLNKGIERERNIRRTHIKR